MPDKGRSWTVWQCVLNNICCNKKLHDNNTMGTNLQCNFACVSTKWKKKNYMPMMCKSLEGKTSLAMPWEINATMHAITTSLDAFAIEAAKSRFLKLQIWASACEICRFKVLFPSSLWKPVLQQREPWPQKHCANGRKSQVQTDCHLPLLTRILRNQ